MITALIISEMPKEGVEIDIFVDEGSEMEVSTPENTSDLHKMAQISKRGDMMYGFTHQSVRFKYKIPAYVGEFVFKDLGLFLNTAIYRKDRVESVGREADERGRANRYVVHKGNIKHLENVFSATEQSIYALTKTVPWGQELRKIGMNYHNKKSSLHASG